MTTEGSSLEKLEVRSMESEDISAVLEIDRKISGVKRAITYSDMMTGVLGGELSLSFVAETGGKVVGFIMSRHAYVGDPVADACLIQIIGIDPEYQRQGIATKLVDSLLETCKLRVIETVRVMVDDGDSQLQGFLPRVGFQRGRLVDYTKTL